MTTLRTRIWPSAELGRRALDEREVRRASASRRDGRRAGPHGAWTSVLLLGQCCSQRWGVRRGNVTRRRARPGCCLASRWSRGTPGARSRRARDRAPRRTPRAAPRAAPPRGRSPRPLPPRLTSAVTAASKSSTLRWRATRPRALAKHAAYPAAKSCSGLVPAPLPPSSRGAASATSRRPSEVTARPSRPEAVAEATYWAVWVAVLTQAPGARRFDWAHNYIVRNLIVRW